MGYNSDILKVNPFRYRGYYYDNETNLYYLNSRYYDPDTRRFINADDIGAVTSGKALGIINGQNLYSYSLNNPVTNYDPSGYFAITTGLVVSVIFLLLSVAGFVGAAIAFAKEPDIKNLIMLILGAVGVALSCIGFISALKAALAIPKAASGSIATAVTTKPPKINRVDTGISVDDFINSNVPKEFQAAVYDGFGADAKVSMATQNITVNRYYGGNSLERSFWITPYMYKDPVSSLALPLTNNATKMATFVLPKGTYFIEGTVVALNGQFGGGYQFYIANPLILLKI